MLSETQGVICSLGEAGKNCNKSPNPLVDLFNFKLISKKSISKAFEGKILTFAIPMGMPKMMASYHQIENCF